MSMNMNTHSVVEPNEEGNAAILEAFDSFALALNSSLTLDEILGVAANDGRVFLNCDRVSIGIRYGEAVRIQSVSGQDRIVNRSNSIRILETICVKAVRLEQPLVFGIDQDSKDSETFADYVYESHVRTLIVLPLHPNKRAVTAPQKVLRLSNVVGCLIIEEFEKKQDARLLERAELIVDHVANAINNCRIHGTIFGASVLRRIGQLARWFEGKKLWSAIAILALVVSFIAVCLWGRASFRVTADGTLMPIVRREVFAPWNSRVIEIFVKDGQAVEKNAPLLRLASSELDAQLIAARAAVFEKQKLVATLESQVNRLRDQVDVDADYIRLQGDLKKAEIELTASSLHLDVISERRNELLIRAPLRGVVVTFQIEQLLLNRPVTRGEQLLHIVDPTGDWQIELNVKESRAGHILSARKSMDEPLRVDYSIATDVERRSQGTLVDVSSRVNESEKHGAVVNAIVAIDSADQLERKHVGAEVNARIHCGDKCLGYVLFGDVIEFLFRRFWI